MRVSKKEALIQVLSFREEGLTYSESFKRCQSKWGLAESTFARYWKETEIKYTERQKQLENSLLEQRKELLLEKDKKTILTKLERLEIATKIARGEGRKIAQQLIIPTDNERLKALDYLSKIEGDYSSEKLEIEHSGGFDIKTVVGFEEE